MKLTHGSSKNRALATIAFVHRIALQYNKLWTRGESNPCPEKCPRFFYMLIPSFYLKGQRMNKLFPSDLVIGLRAASQQIALQPATATFEPCGV